MPLDGEEHACAKHENLECKKDYRKPIYWEPIHHFSISRLLLVTVYYEGDYLKTVGVAVNFGSEGLMSKNGILVDPDHRGLI